MKTDILFKCLIAFLFGFTVFCMIRRDGLMVGGEEVIDVNKCLKKMNFVSFRQLERMKQYCFPFIKNFFTNKGDLKDAVNIYLDNPENAKKKYGLIENWDTSNVTNMSYMFDGATTFNWDISSWDISSIMDMSGIFPLGLEYE